MKPSGRRSAWFLAASLILCLSMFEHVWGQTASSTEPAQSGVVLTKLFPPVYPPLSRLAGISGDVVVRLSIAPDGSVKSAELFSGHPMLAPAAVESARKSQFECPNCNQPLTSYMLTYTFGFFGRGRNREVVFDQRFYAPRCLYLWKCGTRQVTLSECPEFRAAEVTESPGLVTIFASVACVETDASSSNPNRQ